MRILQIGDPHYSSENIASRRDNYPETLLNKTEQFLDLAKTLKVDLILLSGDFCHTKRLSLTFLNKLMYLFSNCNISKASVIGNHDEHFGKPETVERGPLGTMFTSGVFLPRPGEWTYENKDTIVFFIPYMLDPMPLYISNPENKKLVLASHYFFERPEFKEALPDDYLDKFDYILLGHDHDPYPIKQVGRAKIIRPGSLTRGTRHKSNFTRPVQVALIDTLIDECKYIPLIYKPASEIFSKERMERELSVRNSKIVEDLSKKVNINETENVENILNSFDVDNEVMENTRSWLRTGGII